MLKKFDFYAQLIIAIAALILGIISLFIGTYFYFALLLLMPLGIWQVISAACHTFSGGTHNKKQILKNYWIASLGCIIIFFASILFRDNDGNELGTGMLGIAIAASFLTALYYLYIYKKYLLHAKQTEENTGIGASENPARYSYLAINRLTANNHPVIAIGRKNGKAGNTEIITEHPLMNDVDTVTLYLNEQHQKEYYDYIFSLNPKRIIFNPGAENDELAELAADKGVKTIEACTLVLLSTGQY